MYLHPLVSPDISCSMWQLSTQMKPVSGKTYRLFLSSRITIGRHSRRMLKNEANACNLKIPSCCALCAG